METTKDSQISNDIISFRLYYFYNITGVLHIRQGKNGLTFDLKSSVISTIIHSVILYCLVTHINAISTNFNPETDVMHLLILVTDIGFQLAGQPLITVTAIVNGVKLMFNNVLTPLIKVEKLLISMGSVGKSDGHGDELFFSFLCVLISGIGLIEVTLNNEPWIIVFGIISCQIYLAAIGVIFMTLCKRLTSRFIRLNNVIADYGNLGGSNMLDKDLTNVSIQGIREAHFLLCEAIEEINSNFGVQLLAFFIYLFVEIVIKPFFIVQSAFKLSDINHSHSFVILSLCTFAFSIIYLVIIPVKSTRTTYHAKKTEFLVSSLLSPEMSSIARKEIKYALLQICSNTQELRVLNLFTIDLTIITSFAGMAVTYLIIILQFGSASTTN